MKSNSPEDQDPLCEAIVATKNCHLLTSNGDNQPNIQEGLWVIITFAEWSAPDVFCATQTMKYAESLETGFVRFGFFRFGDLKEIETLLPEPPDPLLTPIWYILRERIIVGLFQGPTVLPDVKAAINRLGDDRP